MTKFPWDLALIFWESKLLALPLAALAMIRNLTSYSRLFNSIFLLVSLVILISSCDGEEKTTDSIAIVPTTDTIMDTPVDPTTDTPEDRAPSARICEECDTFDYQGIQREYVVHVPENLPDNAPLVFVLHGSNGIASKYPGWLLLDTIASTQGFAVVYPQGLLSVYGETHWNAGLSISSTDDVGFLSALAQYLQNTYGLNSERTFVCGYSNGGFMSYELIARRPDVFKAAASLNGTMSGETWKNRNTISPVPVLQLSGALDKAIPIDGSLSLAGGWGGAPDMETVIQFLADLGGTTTSETMEIRSNTTVHKYQNGIDGKEVWYYLLSDYGHEFPLGENGNINSAELVWEFFSKF